MKDKMSKMNPGLFKAIKAMISYGATIEETAEFFKLGHSTVSRVKSCENFDEYKNSLAAMYAKKKAKQAEIKPVVDVVEIIPSVIAEAPKTPEIIPGKRVSEYYSDNRVWDALKKQNELLELISNKLAFIVEQLA